MSIDRKKEVINICLDHFIEQGLYETSTRSLSSALNLQPAGLYYYFRSKDEAVLLCSEEAVYRLERELISVAISCLDNPDYMVEQLKIKADLMAPTMNFLVSVRSCKRYRDQLLPILDKLAVRYKEYARIISKKLNCKEKDIEPYVYMIITAISNYMIFSEDIFINPQMEIIKKVLHKVVNDCTK